MSQTSPNDQVLTKLGPVAQAVINDDILSAMGLGNISETEKNEFYSMMVSTVQDRVLARILDELSQDEQHQLTQLLSHTGAAEAEAFIAEHIQNLDDLTMQEALLYKAEMIENAKHIQDALGIQDTSSVNTSEPPESVDKNLPAVVENELPVPYTPPALPAEYHPDDLQK